MEVRFPKKLSKFVDSMLAETILGRVNILMIQFFQQVMLIYGLTCCALAICFKAKPDEFLFQFRTFDSDLKSQDMLLTSSYKQ